MREKIIVIVLFLTPWIIAAPSEFFWEEDSDEKDSSETIKPKPIPTTTEKSLEIFNKPVIKPIPDPPTTTTTTTQKPKPAHPSHPQHPFPPFHHKPPPLPPPPPNPQFPQFFGNPFIFNPFPAFNPTPIGFLTQELFSPVPGQTVPFEKKTRKNDEGVKRSGPQVTCSCVGGASDDPNPFDVTKRVKRQDTPKNNPKNLERRRKKKKKQQKPTPKPTDTLLEEGSNTAPGVTTIKEQSIEAIQTGSQNNSETTQTHITTYYMVYVVEVQQSKNNTAQTVVSEQTTSNVNQATASPEASFIAEAAGAIPTEETFSQFQGTTITNTTAKPGGINIDQTGSATNNGNGQQEGAGSDEDEEGFLLPLFDLTDDDDDDKSGKT